MNWILLAVVGGAALICPLTMFGPMLLQRLGLRKGDGQAGMSCMGMTSKATQDDANDVNTLRSRRDDLDREIARVQASSQQDDAEQPPQGKSEPAAGRV